MNKAVVYRLLLFYAITVGISTTLHAQDPYEDNQLWTGVSTDFKIVKRLKFEGAAEMRLSENFGSFKSFLLKSGLRYKLSKNIKVSAVYRWTHYPEFFNRNRVTIKGSFKDKICKRTYLSLGLKYQTDFNALKKFEEVVFLDDQVLRPKIQLSHKIKKKKLYPFISAEAFYHLHYKGNQFEQFRLSVGNEFVIDKHNALEIAYVRSWETNVKNLLNRNIFTVGYHHSF